MKVGVRQRLEMSPRQRRRSGFFMRKNFWKKRQAGWTTQDIIPPLKHASTDFCREKDDAMRKIGGEKRKNKGKTERVSCSKR